MELINNNWDEDQPIYRFMRIDRFLEMLAMKALFVPNVGILQKTQDPKEGSLQLQEFLELTLTLTKPNRFRLFKTLGDIIDYNLEQSNNSTNERFKNLENYIKTNFFISSWNLNYQSKAMWHYYTGNDRLGVCLQTTYEKLNKGLKKSDIYLINDRVGKPELFDRVPGLTEKPITNIPIICRKISYKDSINYQNKVSDLELSNYQISLELFKNYCKGTISLIHCMDLIFNLLSLKDEPVFKYEEEIRFILSLPNSLKTYCREHLKKGDYLDKNKIIGLLVLIDLEELIDQIILPPVFQRDASSFNALTIKSFMNQLGLNIPVVTC